MAGLAIVLDLLKSSPKVSSHSLHSFGSLSATVAASVAAASAAVAGRPRFLFGDGGVTIAYCDAAAAQREVYIPGRQTTSDNPWHRDSLKNTKQYPMELKPLFSAFEFKPLLATTVRSFLLFFLPLLEPRPPVEEDEDFPQDDPEPVDFTIPLKNSVKQIIRETTVVTTRRMLERLAVNYCSERMAWKLLKDVSRSARRKAGRQMPTSFFCYSVSRATFRGHMLGVTASWFIQILIEVYRCFIRKPNGDDVGVENSKKLKIFGRKVYGTTVKCTASLVFASIGAGIGVLFHPSAGQWIGCALGDFAGPIIAILVFETLHMEL